MRFRQERLQDLKEDPNKNEIIKKQWKDISEEDKEKY